jgi:hypothetical protein
MSSFAVRTVAGQACKGIDRMDTIVDPDNGFTVLGWELVKGDRSVVIRAEGESVVVTLGYLGTEVGRGTFTDTLPSLIVPFVTGHLA